MMAVAILIVESMDRTSIGPSAPLTMTGNIAPDVMMLRLSMGDTDSIHVTSVYVCIILYSAKPIKPTAMHQEFPPISQ